VQWHPENLQAYEPMQELFRCMPSLRNNSPIGVFDSGVGGLSVLRAIWAELPDEDYIYLADQAHVPYGPRPLQEVRSFAKKITQFLLDQDAKLIVVACNAASAAALHELRSSFPRIPFVGMEPAVKPAAERTQSGAVGVLATPATFQGALYASVVERFAYGVQLYQDTCPGLVDQIESGNLNSAQTRQILETALIPMLSSGIDTVVLGCTHYPFAIPLIENIVGPDVRVIDPSPAVARQVLGLLSERRMLSTVSVIRKDPATHPNTRYLTSGDPNKFLASLEHLLDIQTTINGVFWENNKLILPLKS